MAAARKRAQRALGKEPAKAIIIKNGFIATQSIKGEYTSGADALSLFGGKDGRYEYRSGGAQKVSFSGTYYCRGAAPSNPSSRIENTSRAGEHNEGVEIEVRLETPRPQVVVVNLKSRTFSRGAGAAGESPPTSAKRWTRYVDAESGYPYLLCEETGESRWETAPAA